MVKSKKTVKKTVVKKSAKKVALAKPAKKAIIKTKPVIKKKVLVKVPTKTVSPEERFRMITERAFKRAEARGFVNGTPDQDWLEAEREVSALLSK